MQWGEVAQLVEQRTPNPSVGGSIPSLFATATLFIRKNCNTPQSGNTSDTPVSPSIRPLRAFEYAGGIPPGSSHLKPEFLTQGLLPDEMF